MSSQFPIEWDLEANKLSEKVSKLIDAVTELAEIVGMVANSIEEFATEVENVLNLDISRQFHRDLSDMERDADKIAQEIVKLDEIDLSETFRNEH